MDSATCIVALAHEGTVWIGGDSLSIDVSKSEQAILTNPKVFKKTDTEGTVWLFGFSGTYRFGQLLQYNFELPSFNVQANPLQFMVSTFVPALQQCLRKAGFEQKEKDRVIGGNALIGVQGRIFNVGIQYSVVEYNMPYNAIGCGAPYAIGSLFSTQTLNPYKRIELALQAAEAFSIGVQRPFVILDSNTQ